jgi:hypothetical protein
MPRRHRHDRLPSEDLWPADLSPIIEPQQQAEHMRELRMLHNRIAEGYYERDDRMLALSLSNALSRRDMAIATGLAESRVNQIIREHANADQHRKNTAAVEQVARHMPDAMPMADR